MSWVYSAIAAIASRMSTMRMRQVLGGIDGLAQDRLAKLRVQGGRSHEVNRGAYNTREVAPKAEEFEQANVRAGLELDEDVDIRVLAHLSASDRTKHGQALHRELPERNPLAAQFVEHLVTGHGRILAPSLAFATRSADTILPACFVFQWNVLLTLIESGRQGRNEDRAVSGWE